MNKLKRFWHWLKYQAEWELFIGTLIFIIFVLAIGTGLYFLLEWAWERECG